MSRHLLIDDLEEDSNFFVTAIKTSNIEEYLFVFRLNSQSELQFQREEDLLIPQAGIDYCFPQYLYKEEKSDGIYKLIANNSFPVETNLPNDSLFSTTLETKLLLPKFSNFNFLLKTNIPLTEQILLLLQADESIEFYKTLLFEEYKELLNFIA